MEKGEKFIIARGPFMGFDATITDKTADGQCYWCDVEIFGTIQPKVFISAECLPLSLEQLAESIKGLSIYELKTLRAIINGKISKRKITPEQQEAMQKARKKKST